jgi:hypothetical protein
MNNPGGLRRGLRPGRSLLALALALACGAGACNRGGDPAGAGEGKGVKASPAGRAPGSGAAAGNRAGGQPSPAPPGKQPSFLSTSDKLNQPPDPESDPPCPREERQVRGVIDADAHWCGEVRVEGHVRVAAGATLTIAPGTRVYFKPYRGLWEPERRLRLRVEGRLLANGRRGAMIRFSSGHADPVNGDWEMVELRGANGSRISYARFEYGRRGLWIEGTEAKLDHVVARFNNREGIAVHNGSKVTIASSRIYANGYNCVDVKKDNEVQIRGSYLANCGVVGVHVSRSSALLEQNLLEGHSEAVYLGGGARVILRANRFNAPRGCALSCAGKNTLRMANNVFDGIPRKLAVDCEGSQVQRLQTTLEAPTGLLTGIREGDSSYIDYIPGRRGHDAFSYLLPDRHATRRLTTRLGEDLGLVCSVALDGKQLLLANLDGQVMRVEPATGDVVERFKAPGTQPRGMVVFKERLFINDYLDRKIYAVDPHDGELQGQFSSPDPRDGCIGITTDGENLYLLGWATPRVYHVSPEGKLLDSFAAPAWDLGAGIKLPVRGGLEWDGEAFWAPADRLLRFDRTGKVLGWIHGPADRIWDMAWDGEALWTTIRTREAWTHSARVVRVLPLTLEPPEP